MKIHTFDAREYVMWEVMQNSLKLSQEDMHKAIREQYDILQNELNLKNIKYSNLKNVLTPQKDRYEICLVFDTLNMTEAWYGLPIYKRVLPILAKLSNHSVSMGDLVGSNENQYLLRDLFFKEIKNAKETTFRNSVQYYLIYINNLSDAMVSQITAEIHEYDYYVGYFDFTFNSLLKTYVSGVIGQHFLIYNKQVIVKNPEDVITKENRNFDLYPYEENGFNVISISNTNYESFLSYKIEREVIANFDQDNILGLNSISAKVNSMQGINIQIDEAKIEYLKREKMESLGRLKLASFTKHTIENSIKEKILSNYFFNFEFMEDYQIVKFNTMLEFSALETGEIIKILVSLEYKYNDNILRVITMY